MIMIAKENVKINGIDFIYTYSDSQYLIKQTETGELYGEAYDLAELPKEYEETDIKIDDFKIGEFNNE